MWRIKFYLKFALDDVHTKTAKMPTKIMCHYFLYPKLVISQILRWWTTSLCQQIAQQNKFIKHLQRNLSSYEDKVKMLQTELSKFADQIGENVYNDPSFSIDSMLEVLRIKILS